MNIVCRNIFEVEEEEWTQSDDAINFISPDEQVSASL